MINRLNAFVQKRDLFGHAISFNFDQQGSQHRTAVGGSTSIFIYAFMIFLTYINVNKLVFNLDDKNTS